MSLSPAGYTSAVFTIGGKAVSIDTKTPVPDMEQIKYTLSRTSLVTKVTFISSRLATPIQELPPWFQQANKTKTVLR